MNNIRKTDTSQSISTIKNLIHNICPEFDFWKYENGNWDIGDRIKDTKQFKCSHNVYVNEVVDIRNKRKTKSRNIQRENIDKITLQVLNKPQIIDDDLKKCLLLYKGIVPIMMSSYQGQSVANEGFARGTKRYESRKAFIIRRSLNDFSKEKKCTAFLTITCDVSLYKNREDAWVNFWEKEIKPVLFYLKKKYGILYAGVLESTKKGYPHAHFVIFCNDDILPNWYRAKPGSKVRSGDLWNDIQERKHSKVVELQYAKGKAVNNYLTKYITKCSKNDMFSLAKKEGELTTDERKTILCYLAAMCTHSRTLWQSQNKSKAKQEREKKDEIELEYLERKNKHNRKLFRKIDKLGVRSAKRKRAYLINICNNSPITCKKQFYSVGFGKYEKVAGGFPEKNHVCTPEEINVFKEKGTFLGCNGCLWSEIREFILNPESSKLNYYIYKYGEEVIIKKFSEICNLDDDKEWLKCISFVISYYLRRIYEEHKSFQDILCEIDYYVSTASFFSRIA